MTPQPPQQLNIELPAVPAPGLLGGMAPADAADPVTSDQLLRWVKEAVAALIAITIVVCLVIMLWRAFGVLKPQTTDDKTFECVKDLLLFINPLVGVVIGYYFNRVSTEARAENAERTAQGATAAALGAEAARSEAQSLAQHSQTEADAAEAALKEVIPAAQTLLVQMPATRAQFSTESGIAATDAGGSADPLLEARVNLRTALERARAVAGHSAH
jgi:hypothetical protein